MLIELSHSFRKVPFYNKFIGRRLAEGCVVNMKNIRIISVLFLVDCGKYKNKSVDLTIL